MIGTLSENFVLVRSGEVLARFFSAASVAQTFSL